MRSKYLPLILVAALAACGGAPDDKSDSVSTAASGKISKAAASPLKPFVQSNDPDFAMLPERGADAAAFVPTGWTTEKAAKTDFNGDGHQDILIIMHQHDPAKIKPLNERTDETLDSNPYRIAVAFYDPAQRDYVLAAENHTLISRHEDPRFIDPFNDATTGKGVFVIALSKLANLGGWSAETRAFKFRFQDGAFRLIGLDVTESPRNGGEYTSRSINYLTHRMKIETGQMEEQGNGEVKWQELPRTRGPKLDEVGDGLAFAVPTA